MSKEPPSAAANAYCRFVRIQDHHGAAIRREDVLELTDSQKNSVFGHAFSRIADKAQKSASTLTRVQALSPDLSSCLVLKAAHVNDFVFRLIKVPGDSLTANEPSYVALSYRWGAGKQTLARTNSQLFYQRQRDSIELMPIPSALYAAILSELDSTFEGIWCDQACINQADPREKAISVGMMNLVYEQARYVAIVLADIKITTEERQFLESYAASYADYQQSGNYDVYFHGYENPSYLSVQPVLRAIYLKLLNAEWFSRCWCSHEMRMSRYQIFYVACDEEDTVCRITGPFLFDLILLAAEVPNPWTATLLRPFTAAHHTVLNGVFERPYPNMILEPFEHINSLFAGGDPDPHLSESERALTGARDKLSITLNTMQLDFAVDSKAFLALAGRMDPVLYSIRLLSALSLALGDPLVLGTTGAPLPGSVSSPTHSWLRFMNRSDVPGNQQSTEESLALDPSEQITLSASTIDSNITLQLCALEPADHRVSLSLITLASVTLETLLAHSPIPVEASDAYYPWRGTARGADIGTRSLFQHTLACLLSLGPAWMLSALSVAKGGFIIASELQTALSPFQESGFPGLAFGNGDLQKFILWARSFAGASALALVAQFAIFILQRALPGPWTPEMVAAYLPSMLTSDSGDRHLIVLPRAETQAKIAVPKCLLEDRFYDMCRVWLLEDVERLGERVHTLRGRVRIFGPTLASQSQGVAQGESDHSRTRVYGPLKENMR